MFAVALPVDHGHLRPDDSIFAQALQSSLHGRDRQPDLFGDGFGFKLAVALNDIENVSVKAIQLFHCFSPILAAGHHVFCRICRTGKIILHKICKMDENCAKKPRYFIIILRKLSAAGTTHVGSTLSRSSCR